MARGHRLEIGIGTLGLEVVPGQEAVQGVEVFLLRDEAVEPYLLDLAEGIGPEEQVDFLQVEVQQGLLNQYVIGDIPD